MFIGHADWRYHFMNNREIDLLSTDLSNDLSFLFLNKLCDNTISLKSLN